MNELAFAFAGMQLVVALHMLRNIVGPTIAKDILGVLAIALHVAIIVMLLIGGPYAHR